jgi:hypothetical protein
MITLELSSSAWNPQHHSQCRLLLTLAYIIISSLPQPHPIRPPINQAVNLPLSFGLGFPSISISSKNLSHVAIVPL